MGDLRTLAGEGLSVLARLSVFCEKQCAGPTMTNRLKRKRMRGLAIMVYMRPRFSIVDLRLLTEERGILHHHEEQACKPVKISLKITRISCTSARVPWDLGVRCHLDLPQRDELAISTSIRRRACTEDVDDPGAEPRCALPRPASCSGLSSARAGRARYLSAGRPSSRLRW